MEEVVQTSTSYTQLCRPKVQADQSNPPTARYTTMLRYLPYLGLAIRRSFNEHLFSLGSKLWQAHIAENPNAALKAIAPSIQ